MASELSDIEEKAVLVSFVGMSSIHSENGERVLEAIEAYSETERNSIKTFSDMAYGYYDKDSQSQMSNTFLGMV